MKDIEQRAEESWRKNQKIHPQGINPHAYVLGFKIAMTEERERGKRFVQWLFKNNLYFVNDDIFNSFLAEEKELNN